MSKGLKDASADDDDDDDAPDSAEDFEEEATAQPMTDARSQMMSPLSCEAGSYPISVATTSDRGTPFPGVSMASFAPSQSVSQTFTNPFAQDSPGPGISRAPSTLHSMSPQSTTHQTVSYLPKMDYGNPSQSALRMQTDTSRVLLPHPQDNFDGWVPRPSPFNGIYGNSNQLAWVPQTSPPVSHAQSQPVIHSNSHPEAVDHMLVPAVHNTQHGLQMPPIQNTRPDGQIDCSMNLPFRTGSLSHPNLPLHEGDYHMGGQA